MCGIAGMYHLNREEIPSHCLKPMCDAMSHRGPDDSGYVYLNVMDEPYKDESYCVEKDSRSHLPSNREQWQQHFNDNGQFNLALGHRRLSIIDLSKDGHQPMSNRANGIWVTYNGEIYNYKELRQELVAKRHHFFSQTDTEVIIHLYEEYGVEAIKKMNGIFSFALWDGRHNRLILARDRYGAKPLYYSLKNNLLCFSSEIKGLLEVDGVEAKLNDPALCEYFTFQNNFGDTTLFDGIKMMPPGHFMILQGSQVLLQKYWDFDFHEEEDRGEDYYVNTLRELFGQAVKRQLMADVPVGTYLSGGMDSGSITAFASSEISRLMTFTGGFDTATAVSIENFFDERKKAEVMSRAYGTEHYQMVMHAGDLEWALPRVIRHTEDLRVGMSYPHYYIAQLAGKFVKVVLAGAGGDETLAGYPWRYLPAMDSSSSQDFESTTYKYWSRLIGDDDRKQFFSRTMMNNFNGYSPLESLRKVLKGSAPDSYLKRALYFDAKTFLHGILVIEDKLSMAHSLESRVPFLDNDLVDFTTGIPDKYLLNNSWIKAAETDCNLSGKYVFRKAMENILPHEIIVNRKQGFSAPEQSWYMKQLVEYIENTILCDRSLDRGYFQRPYIEKILGEHISGRANHRLLIWSLLSFEWWNRIFIDGDRNGSGEQNISHKSGSQQISRTESGLVSEPSYG